MIRSNLKKDRMCINERCAVLMNLCHESLHEIDTRRLTETVFTQGTLPKEKKANGSVNGDVQAKERHSSLLRCVAFPDMSFTLLARDLQRNADARLTIAYAETDPQDSRVQMEKLPRHGDMETAMISTPHCPRLLILFAGIHTSEIPANRCTN